MQRVEQEIARLVDEVGFDEAKELFSKLSGGKRLRAKLILKIAKTDPKAPLLAAIVELIHAASLLHDDVIDDAMSRRGEVSVNATEGSKVAIMLGDILYSKAYSELVGFDKNIAKTISSSVTSLSIGEMMDVAMGKEFNKDEQKYLKMLYLKTSALIEASAAAAAMLEGYEPQKYAIYGKNLGLSFQIIDDILDITSDEQTLGKPALNDFVEGKATLPYIYLYHDLDKDEKERLLSLHLKKPSKDEELWLRESFAKHKSIERSFEVAKKLSYEAAEAIKGDIELESILNTMIKRSY